MNCPNQVARSDTNERDVSRLRSVPSGYGEHMSPVAGDDVLMRRAADRAGVDEMLGVAFQSSAPVVSSQSDLNIRELT